MELRLVILTKIDRPSLPKMDIYEKRTFIFDKIANFLKENDFKKRGNHFFKSNGVKGQDHRAQRKCRGNHG